MEVTLIGVICLLACVLVVARPMDLGLVIFGVFLPLQTAAAFNLWAVGGLSIICAHVIIGAFVIAIAFRPRLTRAFLRDAAARPAVLTLGAFVVLALLSAIFLPRLFEGAVQVYSLERPDVGTYRITPLSHLHPTTGNITQSVYMTANFALFAFLAFAIARLRGVNSAMAMLNAATLTHLAFGFLSIFPQIAPVAMILDAVRTANYSIFAHHTFGGMTRLIGSYAEAAAFGSMSLGLFAYNALRFLQTRGLWFFTASVLLFGCIVLSFSTTAYAGLALLVMLWCLHSSFILLRGGLSGDQLIGFFLCILTAAGLVLLLLFDPARHFLDDVYLRLFGEKLQSASGLERSAWNLQGLKNLIDTGGLGVGLGSARTSSLITVLLSNVGVAGTLAYAAFLGTSFLRNWPKGREAKDFRARRVFVAARAAALAMLITHMIAGGNVDGGLQFFVFAATAAGVIAPRPRYDGSLASIFPRGESAGYAAQPVMEFPRARDRGPLFASVQPSESA
ncbi:MAG: hypothetical protein AB7P23_02220 [Amphiplicatus sp.]